MELIYIIIFAEDGGDPPCGAGKYG